MTASQLDVIYTAMAEAITRLGQNKSQLFLATLALDLLAQQENANDCLEMIAQSELLAINSESRES